MAGRVPLLSIKKEQLYKIAKTLVNISVTARDEDVKYTLQDAAGKVLTVLEYCQLIERYRGKGKKLPREG